MLLQPKVVVVDRLKIKVVSEWVSELKGKGLQQQLLVVVTGSASNYCSSPCTSTSSSEESASEHLDCSPAVYRGWCWCLKIASDKSKNVSLMLAWALLWRCCCCYCCVTAPTVDKKESCCFCCCWCTQKMKLPFGLMRALPTTWPPNFALKLAAAIQWRQHFHFHFAP